MRKVSNAPSSKKRSSKERARQTELKKEGREHSARTKGKRAPGEKTSKKRKQKKEEDRHLPRNKKELEMVGENRRKKGFSKESTESMEAISDIRQDLGLADSKKKKEKFRNYHNDVKDLISTYRQGLALIFSTSGDEGKDKCIRNPLEGEKDRGKSITKDTTFGGVTHSIANSAMGAYGNYLSELRDEHNSAIVTLMRVSSKESVSHGLIIFFLP